MKIKLPSISVLSLAAALALVAAVQAKTTEPKFAPLPQPPKPRIEVCFVLDTTGSMGGLIEGAKQKIWSIANAMIAAKPTPDLQVGLVAYRDRGDDYVTKTVALTNDMDLVYARLKEFAAGGGGDTPESVNEALQDAVQKMAWSKDRDVLKIIFLVGDAPPHMDYADGPKYQQVCQDAMKADLVINTVQCGDATDTATIWRDIAKLGEGRFAAIPQSGNMTAIATPMDAELGQLNQALNGTVIAYGDAGVQHEISSKVALAVAAPASVAADRLAYNMTAGVTVQGKGELLDGLAAGSVKWEDIKTAELPADLQKLSSTELKATVAAKQKERSDLQAKINQLSADRDKYIDAERQRLAAAGKTDSFDAQVTEIIHAEAARKGITYAP